MTLVLHILVRISVIPKVPKALKGMKITINHQIEEVVENARLHDVVLEQTGGKLHGIAVAVNHVVIPRERHAAHILQANDNVLIIKATQGG